MPWEIVNTLLLVAFFVGFVFFFREWMKHHGYSTEGKQNQETEDISIKCIYFDKTYIYIFYEQKGDLGCMRNQYNLNANVMSWEFSKAEYNDFYGQYICNKSVTAHSFATSFEVVQKILKRATLVFPDDKRVVIKDPREED